MMMPGSELARFILEAFGERCDDVTGLTLQFRIGAAPTLIIQRKLKTMNEDACRDIRHALQRYEIKAK